MNTKTDKATRLLFLATSAGGICCGNLKLDGSLSASEAIGEAQRAVNEHSALLAVAEAASIAFKSGNLHNGLRDENAMALLGEALSTLNDLRSNPHTGETNDEKEIRIAGAFGIKTERPAFE